MMELLAKNESYRKLLMLNKRAALRAIDVQCISRDGRSTRYATSTLVPYLLKLTLEEFEENFEKHFAMAELAVISAKFWVWFVAIHPFADGNVETARAFLKTRLAEKGIEIFRFESIERFRLSGERSNEDVKRIAMEFLLSMRPVEGL